MNHKVLNISSDGNIYSIQTEWGETIQLKKPNQYVSNEDMGLFIEDVVQASLEKKFFASLIEKNADLQIFKLEAISFVYSVPVNTLYEYEIRLARLINTANLILKNPSQHKNMLFDGKNLPDNESEVVAYLTNYLNDYLEKSTKIENINLYYSKLVHQLSLCKTVDDINKVRWQYACS